MPDRSFGDTPRTLPLRPILIVAVLLVLLVSAKFIASLAIDLEWWEEMHQIPTWISIFLYGSVPIFGVAVLYFVAFWTAYRLGLSRADSEHRPGASLNRLIAGALVVLSVLLANVMVDSWTVVRYFAGLRLAPSSAQYADPVFHLPLRFYFFELPFYNMLLGVVLAGVIVALVAFWAAAHLGQVRNRLQFASPGVIELNQLALGGSFDYAFIRVLVAVLLFLLAGKFYFDRYDFLVQDHGVYLVGVDWVVDHLTLPLQWLLVVSALGAAGCVLARRPGLALFFALALPVRYVLPPIVAGVYVRPNELTLEKPYIASHIEATRASFKLASSVTEVTLNAQPEVQIDYDRHKGLLTNVRLWDWQAFHDTISQIQPLRPYIYKDTDVDRYVIDGELRQVLLTPRELDIAQIGEAGRNWINPHFVYTHGYGLVMAEANRITSDGLPVLFIENAPPEIHTKSLKLTKPEIYYSEIAHEPVFVHTTQPEFNYPSGSENVHVQYSGSGGFPVSSILLRLAAAIHYSDANILLTNNLVEGSRMMIHRQILDRLSSLAGFLSWEPDPYLVITGEGRLVWTVDGYMTSPNHPYASALSSDALGRFNYIRNSIKATVDAYSGETHLYVFDPTDPLIAAYWKLFPDLLEDASRMPADLRQHIRYPETLFRAQAEIYRTFHMRDPEAFYNRADLWDIAKTGTKQGDVIATPTYLLATLPNGDPARPDKPEFLLVNQFTPANKDNLIGMMYARCDGDHYGELIFQQLGKQNIIFGPMQIEARINQDQNISKDLTLWNQQGSHVHQGQPLVLPLDNSFLYVEPIYIQASEAKMPQLKKVALAMGNRLAYADTYEEALQQLTSRVTPGAEAASRAAAALGSGAGSAGPATPQAPQKDAAATLEQVRAHLRRYRELTGQGKWTEAGQELEQIDELLKQR